MTYRVGTFSVLGRQIRADAAALVTLAAILFASSAIGAAFPRWLNHIEDEGIQYELRAGQEIAKAGSTGRSTGAHVHFEVWENGRVVNPRNFLSQQSPLKMQIKG